MASISHLPAYAAVGRWVAGRRVVVIGPSGLEGPECLFAGDARRVILVGDCPWATPRFDVRRGVPDLPLADREADIAICIEPYAGYSVVVRRQLVREAHRVLRSGGLFCAWVSAEPGGEDAADFWALEEEIAEVFAGATMVAQIPWRGVSMAPVVDDERVPAVALEEALLERAPEASHYLAVGFRDQVPPEFVERLRSQCMLIPVPGSAGESVEAVAVAPEQPPVAPAADEALAALQEQLATRDTDLRVLTGNVEALEQSLARVSERAEARAKELEVVQGERRELAERCASLGVERDAMAHQVEIATAERAGARQLSERVEAELEQARRRLAENTAQVAERTAEASRLAGELAAVRERLTHQEAALDRSRTQAEELTKTAAKQDEQSRMLAEVATDRDRLRDELTRRAETIQGLEERVWMTREDVQKERLETVRLNAEVERLREQAERAREAETEGRSRIEALSAEIRTVEVQRADAQALLRSRDEQIARLQKDAEALGSESADMEVLRNQMTERGRELAEARSQLEQARARSAEAAQLIKRREEQLSKAGDDLQALRQQVEHTRARASGLTGELEVKTLEVEQLAASVADLQGRLAEQQKVRKHSEEATSDLQRRLELATEDLDQLRNRLRERDQEIADIVSARETSGVELYKLRQELEATSHANEQLEEALKLDPKSTPTPSGPSEVGWPDEAIAEARRLRGQLVAQTRRHAEQLARIARERGSQPSESDLLLRVRTAELEADVRAEEQEHLLTLLEAAEQRIWEMNDASDRNAARLAASLAQLEKHKEQIDETLDELEVTRSLLAAAQSRALEQERLAASERAKLLRAGIDPDGLPHVGKEHEDPFAELRASELMIELHPPDGKTEEGSPAAVVKDRSGSAASSSGSARIEGPRIVVEAVDDDDEAWDEQAKDNDKPAGARRGTGQASQKGPTGEYTRAGKDIGAPKTSVDDPTMPALRLPAPPLIPSNAKTSKKSGVSEPTKDAANTGPSAKK